MGLRLKYELQLMPILQLDSLTTHVLVQILGLRLRRKLIFFHPRGWCVCDNVLSKNVICASPPHGTSNGYIAKGIPAY